MDLPAFQISLPNVDEEKTERNPVIKTVYPKMIIRTQVIQDTLSLRCNTLKIRMPKNTPQLINKCVYNILNSMLTRAIHLKSIRLCTQCTHSIVSSRPMISQRIIDTETSLSNEIYQKCFHQNTNYHPFIYTGEGNSFMFNKNKTHKDDFQSFQSLIFQNLLYRGKCVNDSIMAGQESEKFYQIALKINQTAKSLAISPPEDHFINTNFISNCDLIGALDLILNSRILSHIL